MALLVATPAEKKPAAPKPAAPAAAASSSGGGVKLLIGLGVLIALVVGVVVAWNSFRARMEAKMQGQGGEERLTGEMPSGPPSQLKDSHRVREVGLPTSQVVESDDEDLASPEKKHKPKPPPPPLPLNAPPAERAWRTLKTDYDKLQGNNETTAKKYRMRFFVLQNQREGMPEAQFVKEAGSLDEEVRAELAKPENQ
jgi:hypothetical protein